MTWADQLWKYNCKQALDVTVRVLLLKNWQSILISNCVSVFVHVHTYCLSNRTKSWSVGTPGLEYPILKPASIACQAAGNGDDFTSQAVWWADYGHPTVQMMEARFHWVLGHGKQHLWNYPGDFQAHFPERPCWSLLHRGVRWGSWLSSDSCW